jgi:hypothetical protein
VNSEIWYLIGALTPIVIGVVGLWWRVESQQNVRIEKLTTCNHHDHQAIRKEIIDTKDQLTIQHLQLRDKIQEIWEHLVKQK